MNSTIIHARLGPAILPARGRVKNASRSLARGLAIWVLIPGLMGLGTDIPPSSGVPRHASGYSTPRARASADKVMAARAREINRASVGETRVASYLAAEFGLTEEAIVAEKLDHRTSWGDLTIAHTFSANDKLGMSVAQVLELTAHGMRWGQVAAGLRLDLHDAVRAVNAECRVATGRAKADGRVAPIDEQGF